MIDKDFMTDTKIVGVSQFNNKGIPIQMILPDLKPGDRLYFIRDYGNQYDNNAIKAFTLDGRHIGYISKELAAEIAPFLDKNMNCDLEGVIHEITGGTDGKSYGCNIRIWIQAPDDPSYEEVKAYQESINRQSQGNYQQSQANYQQPSQPIYNTNPPVQNNAPYEPKMIGGWPKWLVITLSIFMLFAVIASIYAVSSVYFTPTSGKIGTVIDDDLITLDEYNKLKIGMSRTEVYDIVGSFGRKTSETGQIGDDYHIEMYEYEGYGEIGANAQLMFVNGELDTMAQAGLEYE